jgi:GTP-binding protein HflX
VVLRHPDRFGEARLEKFRQTLKVRKERAVLVGAFLSRDDAGSDLAELAALVESAGGVVVDRLKQRIRAVKPATYIGRGKAEELGRRVRRFRADMVIFDNDLSPRQIRELEEIVRAKILDRSEVILDIFAARARTAQAKLQVELAQLEYTYPRLTRMWSHLDSVAGAGGGTTAGAVGGIGTRGPGEKQLEIDRRLVSKRIAELRSELAGIDRRRVREIDHRRGLFKICLVGYTNAGKSTLLNVLTDSDAIVEDRLFATLDTRTRKWALAGGMEVLLSDTVGFIRNLPHQLVASFKATLEEAINADLLLHVIDVSAADALSQIESVDRVLEEIDCGKKPVLTVFNKVDVACGEKGGRAGMLQALFPEAVWVSAKTGYGLDELGKVVAARYKGSEVLLRVSASQSDGRVQSFLRAFGLVVAEHYEDGCVCIDAWLGRNQLPDLRRLRPDNIQIRDGTESSAGGADR